MFILSSKVLFGRVIETRSSSTVFWVCFMQICQAILCIIYMGKAMTVCAKLLIIRANCLKMALNSENIRRDTDVVSLCPQIPDTPV
jgi:small basic protein